jgi:hypothetical protein
VGATKLKSGLALFEQEDAAWSLGWALIQSMSLSEEMGTQTQGKRLPPLTFY